MQGEGWKRSKRWGLDHYNGVHTANSLAIPRSHMCTYVQPASMSHTAQVTPRRFPQRPGSNSKD